jgi:hypothetical protein
MGHKRVSYHSRDIGGPPKDQQWSWYSVEMMQSDAWRDMSVNGRRMLDLLELEHLAHAGRNNGNLLMTYDQFVAGGIRRESIFSTIAKLERLGWLEVTRGLYRGCARTTPHRYRLTHRRTRVIPENGIPYLVEATHDWRRYRSKKSKRMVPEPGLPQYRNRHSNGEIAPGQLSNSAGHVSLASVPGPVPLSISREEGGRGGAGANAKAPSRGVHGRSAKHSANGRGVDNSSLSRSPLKLQDKLPFDPDPRGTRWNGGVEH